MTESRPTMRDVAVASGVSPATVSFVLNGSSTQSISAATRERVEKAAADLGYVPHGIARALREGTSRIVLLNLGPTLRGGGIDSFIAGLDAELAANDHALLVRHGANKPGAVQAVTEAVSPKAVIDFTELYEQDHEADDGGWVDGLAAHTTVQLRYLVEHGHLHIAMAVPEETHRARLADARMTFAAGAATGLGLGAIEQLVVPNEALATATALSAFVAQHPEVTAIAAFDDTVAIRILSVAQQIGIRVPGDLAVIGFDTQEVGAFVTPALTSVRIDAESFGRAYARRVLGLSPAPAVALAATVVERESV